MKKSMGWLWISGALFVMASAVFAIVDLDVSSPRKDTLVKDLTVANEIKSFGQHVINEMRYSMSNNEENKANGSESSNANTISQQCDVDEIPTKPIPPTYEIISDSYNIFNMKWTED
ncbi:hypothetical protein [Sodalis sp. dw_96]|uniref:hypothetical protein n=1 Tax=Sodalis sp. dw_96 TaxID=2719794 RepID=UPI001BD1F5E5|nr:hypothetical protein [Sodalis sp. dw_96]